MERWTMTARRFRQVAMVTTVGVCVLIVAGGVVRLTGSGLGCDDWPNCNSERFVDVSSGHAAIEQINRLLSGLIGLPALAMAVGAFRVRPRPAELGRPGLVAPSIGVLLAILANGVVGGLAVRGDLHPALVQSHFVLALVAVTFGMIAIDRSSDRRVAAPTTVPARFVPTMLVAVGTAVAIVTGTVVTGTGPHAGDEDVRRWGFDISTVARIHSIAVLATIGIFVVLLWRLRGSTITDRDRTALSTWIFVALVQGAIGYLQYFNGVPELLVAVHIAGATLLWVATVHLVQVVGRATSAGSPTDVAHLVGAGTPLTG
jgi:cytochrome c oxidase assembly protein subunit 15